MSNSTRFGIVTDFYGIGIPAERVLRLLAGLGIEDVEVPCGHLTGDVSDPPPANRPEISRQLKNLKKLADDLNIKIWQVHGPYGGNDLVATSESLRRKNIDVYRTWLDWSEQLGAHAMIIHIGGRNDYCNRKDIRFIKETNMDSLARLAAHAENMNLKLAIENLPGRCLETPAAFNRFGTRPEDLLEIIDETGTDKIGVCIDVGHGNVENWDIPAAIRKAGRNLIATHIQENNGVYDMHMLPFSLRPLWSHMDWFEIFRAFKEIDYPYPLIGECANSSGEYPEWLLSKYLKNQKEIIETVLAEIHGRCRDHAFADMRNAASVKRTCAAVEA